MQDETSPTREMAPRSAPVALVRAGTARLAVAQKNVLHVIVRRKWWFIVGISAALTAAVLYLSRQTPIYASSARLYVQRLDPMRYTDGQPAAPQQGSLDAQVDLIRSDTLIKAVARREDISKLPAVQSPNGPAGAIGSGLVVSAAGDYITIGFESAFRFDAAQIANAVVEQYVDLNDKQRRGTTGEVLKILTAERQKRLDEVNNKQQAAAEFKKSHGVLSFNDEKGSIVLSKLARISDSLTTAQLEVMDAESSQRIVKALKDQPQRLLELARAEAPKDSSINIDQSGNSTDPVEQQLALASQQIHSEIAASEKNLSRLLRDKTPQHKEVINAEADLKMLREQLSKSEREMAERREKAYEARMRSRQELQSLTAKDERQRQADRDKMMVDAFVANVDRKLESAKSRASELNKQFEIQKKEAFELNAVAAEYAFSEADLKRSERLLDSIEEKLKEIKFNEDTGLVRVTVLESARPGEVPIRPDRKRVIGLSLLLGVIASIGVAFALEAMDQRLRTVEEIMAVIDVPVLGLIPHISGMGERSTKGREVQLEPDSDVAEAYRTVRTAIYFSVRETQARKILVTSPAPGDGKSTTASNIAIAMAQAGRRVLLIDADFRRPVQHKIFEIDGTLGTTKVMAGLESIDRVVQRSGIEGLDVLPCGPVPANPSELLNGRAFADMLQFLQGRYDHIVLDSPPVAPVTDARILAALCDEVILVLRANKATRRLTEHARESLASVGGRILGTIVNDVPRRRGRYGYYYGYSYGSGYGYGYYGYSYGDKGKGTGNGNGNGSSGAGRKKLPEVTATTTRV